MFPEIADTTRLSVALSERLDRTLACHLDKGPQQEDLTFAFWRPSRGKDRLTAILVAPVLPTDGDRVLHGNVEFRGQYVERVLRSAPEGCGVALLHSHLGPGWQGMSRDDVLAEQSRLAPPVAASTGLPLLGLTRGTDGAWSARFWHRGAAGTYTRDWAATVRVVGEALQITHHPHLSPRTPAPASQVATISVWGEEKQADLARLHVGVVGLGSVGSVVAEALARTGISWITLIDHDHIEERNLDRTLGATPADARARTPKVEVSKRLLEQSHTATRFDAVGHHGSVLKRQGLDLAVDCDVLVSCVDRPWPRHLLNAIAYAHLIPVIDGGILVRMRGGRFENADWRIHTVGPGRSCLSCLGALRSEEVALDMSGQLEDPAYIGGLDPKLKSILARQNVFPFSLSVAAHEVLQLAALVTQLAGNPNVGAQMYHYYPGIMEILPSTGCRSGCQYAALEATAADLTGNLQDDGVAGSGAAGNRDG
jgi:molybdopterin-synthase adenylyltransferase